MIRLVKVASFVMAFLLMSNAHAGLIGESIDGQFNVDGMGTLFSP